MSSPGEHWISYAHDLLAGSGLRKSAARTRVIDLLGAQHCALSAHEIEVRLGSEGHRVGRASIYRTLEVLVARGLIKRIDMGRAEASFEATLPDGHHHHHMVCSECGNVAAFDDHQLEAAIDAVAERLGVTVTDHDVLLRGMCGACTSPGLRPHLLTNETGSH